MVDFCKCKKGFFILTDCKAAASYQCNMCQRPVCTEHLSDESGANTCVECWAKGGKLTAAQGAVPGARTGGPINATYGRNYAYYYRDRYYDYYDYDPLYWGRYGNDPYYRDYDFRSFDSVGQQFQNNSVEDVARAAASGMDVDQLDVQDMLKDTPDNIGGGDWFDS